MKTRSLQAAKAVSLKSHVGCVALALMAMCGSGARAQNADAITAGPRVRVTQAVDEHQMVALPGRVNPNAKPSNDRGLVSDAQPLTRMHLTLQRSAEQQAALSQLMADQQNKNSANYHAWLTPQTFGKQFGPADADVATLTNWLASHGFQNIKVSTGKTAVEFSGTVGQVRSAFRTEIHNYVVNGEEHFANVSVPQIPAALAPIIAGMPALHNFHSKPMLHRVGKFRKNMATGVTQPLFTFTDVNGTFFGLGPADFAKIYNVPAAFTGAGVNIAIVGRSNINIQDVRDFRSMFGLPANDPQIILNGADPGLVSGDEGESDLDVEWSGAVAPGATIKFVATQTTQTDVVDGVFASAFFVVNNNIAHILSQSFGSCEANSDNTDQNLLWEQAAAQGITVVVAAGDNGAANCDDENSQKTAVGGIAVSGAASTPFDTAVGGTDFDDATTQTTFWNATNTSPTQESAKGYIPEIPWNDSCGAAGISGCTAASSNLSLVAGSGGPSSIYSKPSYQVGFGNDATLRDLPDVSLFAGDGIAGTFYIVCESDENIPGDDGCNLTTFSTTSPFHDFQGVGGTSGSAPSFAGIMALVDQKTGQRQGVANYVLYNLAKSETFANCNSSGTVASTCVFNDVTKGNNAVACSGGSPDCSTKTAGGIGVLTTTTGGTTLAFAAGVGYDEATGLGSINVTNLVSNWTALSRIGTTTTLSGPSTATLNATLKYTGTLTKASGTAAPTGVVLLEDMATGQTVDQVALSGSGTTYSISTPFMPAGSYNLVAHYGGDGVYAASDSAPIAINIAKAASTVVVSFVNFVNSNPVLSTSAQNLPYGTPYILRVDVETPNGPCENLNTGAENLVCPTGTISLFKNTGAALNDFPQGAVQNATNVATLNDRGFIEDQPIQLPAGTYSISATYKAATNSSYTDATSNAVAVTITQATTTTTVASAPAIVTAGGMVTLTATVGSQSNSSQGPTGTVQFKNGATTLSMPVTCNPVGATTTVGALCTATLSTALSFVTPPSDPFQLPRVPISTIILTALALAVAFMLGLIRTPADQRRIYVCASVLLLACAVAGLAGCGGGSGSSGGGGGNTHSDSITAVYSGDTNYAASTSTAVAVTVQ
jgi:hypothetical protein